MKKDLSPEALIKRWKKRFYILLTAFSFVIATLIYIIYSNYNYLNFKYLMSYFYIYTETMDDLYKTELKLDPKSNYFKNFDDFVISVVTKKIREVNKDKYTYLFIPESLEKYKQEEKEEANLSTIKKISDNTVYLKITNFSKYTDSFLKDQKKELSKYSKIIIDMQDNYGGDTKALYHMADSFLPKGKVLSVDKMRFFSKTYKSKNNDDLEYKQIVILQNKNSASSAENFIAALKDNLPNVTTIGEKTFGKGIGQCTLPLKSGYAVKATVMKWFTPGGKNIQNNGISPDIVYTDNDIINYAIKYIEAFK